MKALYYDEIIDVLEYDPGGCCPSLDQNGELLFPNSNELVILNTDEEDTHERSPTTR